MWCFRFYLLPCLHMGDIEAQRTNHEKTTLSKTWFFRFYLLPCLHMGDIEAHMDKPRKNHTF